MIRRFAILLLLCCTAAAARAATVTNLFNRTDNRRATTKVLFTPLTVPQSFNGQTWLGGGPVQASVTNGVLSQELFQGVYTTTFIPPAGTLFTTVPPGSGVYNFNDLTTNLLVFAYTNSPNWLISSRVLNGGGFTFVTNHAGLPDETITLTGAGGGGVTNTDLLTEGITNLFWRHNLTGASNLDYSGLSGSAQGTIASGAATTAENIFTARIANSNHLNGSFTGDLAGGTNLPEAGVNNLVSDLAAKSSVTQLTDATNTLNMKLRADLAQTNILESNVSGLVSDLAAKATMTQLTDATNSLNTKLRVDLAQTNILESNVSGLVSDLAAKASVTQLTDATNTLNTKLRTDLAQTNAASATNFSGNLAGDVTGTQSATSVAKVSTALTNEFRNVTNLSGSIAPSQLAPTGVGAGSVGGATVSLTLNYNAAGQLTSATSQTVTPAVTSITGFGANIATALAAALDGSGSLMASNAPIIFNPQFLQALQITNSVANATSNTWEYPGGIFMTNTSGSKVGNYTTTGFLVTGPSTISDPAGLVIGTGGGGTYATMVFKGAFQCTMQVDNVNNCFDFLLSSKYFRWSSPSSFNQFVTNQIGITSTISNTVPDTAITVGASPFNWTNTIGVNLEAVIGAGIVTAISRNGLSLASGLTFTGITPISLQKGQWVTVTYSSAPTMTFHPN